MIAETGSSEFGGSKAAWISDAISRQIPTYYPAIRAFVWLNLKRELEDWAIETSPSAQSAFARAIASPLYAPNEFDDIEGGPIKPLG